MQDNKIEAPLKKVFFIFPSNTSDAHHKNATLYSIKSGGGLAKVADILGTAGFAVLGLPTTGIDPVPDAGQIPDIAKKAVADLWRAVGFGLNPVLPVRTYDYHIKNHTPNGNQKGNGNKYFNNHIFNGEQIEPSFWGGIESTPNTILGDYYVEQLNLLQHFLLIPLVKREQFFSDNNILPELKNAYTEGDKMRLMPSFQVGKWYAKPIAKLDLKTELLTTIPESKTLGQLNDYYKIIMEEKNKSLLRREDGFHKLFGEQGNTNSWQTVVFALKEAALRFAKENQDAIAANDKLFIDIFSLSAMRWLSFTSDKYLAQYEELKVKPLNQIQNK